MIQKVPTHKNIFLTLEKYTNSDENYLTEAFVFILNSLLEKDRLICIKILNYLCVKNDEYAFSPSENISISTQEVTPQGTPDIKISTPDKLIFIEVKHYSGLGEKQIERYKDALKLQNSKKHKYVVLLTRFSVDFNEKEVKPYKYIRWFEVYNWLSNIKFTVKDPISIFLVESFLTFLEVKKMSMQKVGSEYINGIPAMINFIDMLGVAVESESLVIYQNSAGWEWRGFYIQSNKLFCGIYHENPLLLVFEKYKNDGKPTHSFSLNLTAIDFFSLDKDKQLDALITFVKKCKKMISTWQQEDI